MSKCLKAIFAVTILVAILAGSVNVTIFTHMITVAKAVSEADMTFFDDDFAKGIFESGKTGKLENDYGLEFIEYDEKGSTQTWRLGDVDYIIRIVINKETDTPEVNKIEMSVAEENDGKTYTRRGFVKENPNPNDKKGIQETSYYGQRTAMKKGKIDKKSSTQFPMAVEDFSIAYHYILETPTLENVDDMLYYAGNGNWSEMGLGCFGAKAIEELAELADSKSEDKSNKYGFEFVCADKWTAEYRLNGTENVNYSISYKVSGKTRRVTSIRLSRFSEETQRIYGFRRTFFDPRTETVEMKKEIFLQGPELNESIILADADFVQAAYQFMAEPTEEIFFGLFDQLKEK